ncbi:MAG: DUF58 domain-containing protein [Actinobacteria bacterium]|nr:DUF58 domain-containing protein [Actinomycetota bacterium]
MNKRPVVLILVAVSLFMIATTIKSGWLYLVSSAFVSLVLLGILTGWRSTRRIEIERDTTGEIFEGEKLTVSLRIRNNSRAAKYFLNIADMQFLPSRLEAAQKFRGHQGGFSHAPGFSSGIRRGRKGASGDSLTTTVGIENLGPHESMDLKYQLTAARRGVYPETRLEVSSSGIFESVHVRRMKTFASELVVYPKTYPMESFPFHVVDYASSVRPFESSRRGTGLDYFGVREYSPGDSLRHIHWKSSAKRGKLIAREYQHEYQYSLGILLLLQRPRFGSAAINSLEDGLRVAASIIRHLEMTGSSPWLAAFEEGLMNVYEHSGPYELMKNLAIYAPPEDRGKDGPPGLKEGMDSLVGSGVPLGPLAVITNISPGILGRELAGIFEMEGNSIIHILDESYGGDRFMKDVSGDLDVLKQNAVRKSVNLFQHKSGEEIGECLKRPLSVIAA